MAKSNVAPATEIVVSLMSHYADSLGTDQLQSDPRTYIYKTTHISIPQNVDLSVVENTGEVVNLVLPYYDAVSHAVENVGDEQMDDITGGNCCMAVLEVSDMTHTESVECKTCTFGRDLMDKTGGALILIP